MSESAAMLPQDWKIHY